MLRKNPKLTSPPSSFCNVEFSTMENGMISMKSAKCIHTKQELMHDESNSIINTIKNNVCDINELVDETILDDDSLNTFLQETNEMKDASEKN